MKCLEFIEEMRIDNSMFLLCHHSGLGKHSYLMASAFSMLVCVYLGVAYQSLEAMTVFWERSCLADVEGFL